MNQSLILIGKLPSLNEYINLERMNKYAAASLKKRETERVAWECKAQKIKPMKKIDEVFFYYYHDRRGDFDGYEFAQKFIWDGLRDAGVIEDDTQKFTPHIRHHIHRISPERKLEIVLIAYDGKDVNNNSLSSLQRKGMDHLDHPSIRPKGRTNMSWMSWIRSD